jgi:hypothetical protein
MMTISQMIFNFSISIFNSIQFNEKKNPTARKTTTNNLFNSTNINYKEIKKKKKKVILSFFDNFLSSFEYLRRPAVFYRFLNGLD